MRNPAGVTLIICGSAIVAVSIVCGAFIIGRLLGSFPVVNNSNDEYFIWLWLIGIVLILSGFIYGCRVVSRGAGTTATDGRGPD